MSEAMPVRVRALFVFSLVSLVTFSLVIGAACFAEEPDSEPDALRGAPRVFVDCNSCDMDFIRREVNFVNHVRDPNQAEVHILISQQSTASGGREFALEFIGRADQAGHSRILTYSAAEADTDDIVRQGLTRIIQLGLVPFVADTSIRDDLRITFVRSQETIIPPDPWHKWWISIAGNCYLNGEKTYRNLNAYGSLSAQRVTEDIKLRFVGYANYNESKFDYEDFQVLSLSRSKGGNAEAYVSLGDHWSAGGSGSIHTSEYNNLDLRISGSPGIEYNIFPYAESSRRQLRLAYEVGGNHMDYESETIYDKTSELLFFHRLQTTLELIQPWGSVSTSVSGLQYFHDADKYSLSINTDLSWRIFKGLSLTLSGGYSRLNNQLSLRKGDATEDEILLRRRELQTAYRYWTSTGLRYSFGSQDNNIVNPRFGN